MALIYQPSKRIFCGWFEPLKSTTYSEYPFLSHPHEKARRPVPPVLGVEDARIVFGMSGEEDLPAAFGREGEDPRLVGFSEHLELGMCAHGLFVDRRVPRVRNPEDVVAAPEEHGASPHDAVLEDTRELALEKRLPYPDELAGLAVLRAPTALHADGAQFVACHTNSSVSGVLKKTSCQTIRAKGVVSKNRPCLGGITRASSA